MKKTIVFKEKEFKPVQWFWFLAVIGLLTRFPLLRLFNAESTDGILNLTYFTSPYINPQNFYIFPGYPFLIRLGVWLGLDGVLWGRVIASLAGLVFLYPLWKLSRKWVKPETAAMVCLMGLFSPLLWEWSLKAMGDTLFLMAFLFGLERLGAVWLEPGKEKPWVEACFWGAVASLVRPEGFILFPWILYSNEKFSRTHRTLHRLWTLLFWAFPLYLLVPRVELLSLAYREGLGLASGARALDFPSLNFIEHLYVYMTQPVFVFTPILFVVAVLGFYRMIRDREPHGRYTRQVLFPVYLILLFSRLIPTTYQDRHMLPFLPLLLLAAGVELDAFFSDWPERFSPFQKMVWRNGLLVLCLTYEAVFSSINVVAKSDSFGDIKRTSEFLRTLPANVVIYSDEVPKTEYWSGRKVQWLDPTQPFKPHPGEYLVLHSFYRPRIAYMEENLRARHDVRTLHVDQSMVVPLLTDLMQDTTLQNRPGATAFRFQPQFFSSVVYQVGK